MREWDRWLDAKMNHPFFLPLTPSSSSASPAYVAAEGAVAVDLLEGAPSAVPSGAFGGSEDWAVSPTTGAVAFSARPPLSPSEAWETNRHIYLKTDILQKGKGGTPPAAAAEEEDLEALMGT